MNEQLDSQLSAMFDDELPAAECELLARRLSRDEQLKARWESYSLIGAAIRADRTMRLSPELARRVSKALSAESSHTAPAAVGAQRPVQAQWWQPVAGVAVAAGVAATAILWMRTQAPAADGAGVRPLTASDGNTALSLAPVPHASSSPTLYVTPPRSPPTRRIVVPGTSLANYLVAHSEVTSPVAGQALLSVLLSGEGTAAGLQGPEEPVPLEDQDQDDAK